MIAAEPSTTRLVWLTDLHLNFVTRRRAELLVKEVGDASPDAVLLGGDLADAPTLIDQLTLFSDALADIPVAFVLGNHDFYHGSFVEITRAVRALCAQRSNLHWLGGENGLLLGEDATLVGADGWGDGGHGNRRTGLRLNDSVLIEELREAADPMSLCERLGGMSADHLCAVPRAVRTPKVVVLTQHLRAHALGDKLLVVWNGLPIHRHDAIREFFATLSAASFVLVLLHGDARDSTR